MRGEGECEGRGAAGDEETCNEGSCENTIYREEDRSIFSFFSVSSIELFWTAVEWLYVI